LVEARSKGIRLSLQCTKNGSLSILQVFFSFIILTAVTTTVRVAAGTGGKTVAIELAQRMDVRITNK
jgi:hypothetical protein